MTTPNESWLSLLARLPVFPHFPRVCPCLFFSFIGELKEGKEENACERSIISMRKPQEQTFECVCASLCGFVSFSSVSCSFTLPFSYLSWSLSFSHSLL